VSLPGLARRLAGIVPVYGRIAWWGLVAPRLVERQPLRVHQAVVLREGQVLLSVRSDLRGWELPGGNADPGESGEEALCREVREETGIEVSIEAVVGDYARSGFRPHTARIYRCRASRGEPSPSHETPLVRWFALDAVPETLFPWYRAPLADALAEHAEPVLRREHWGVREVLAGLWIDLRMRLTDHRAGSRDSPD
jgi:8-oxo-dGTP pyrophosphatase MutT (NUDIX family)